MIIKTFLYYCTAYNAENEINRFYMTISVVCSAHHINPLKFLKSCHSIPNTNPNSSQSNPKERKPNNLQPKNPQTRNKKKQNQHQNPSRHHHFLNFDQQPQQKPLRSHPKKDQPQINPQLPFNPTHIFKKKRLSLMKVCNLLFNLYLLFISSGCQSVLL